MPRETLDYATSTGIITATYGPCDDVEFAMCQVNFQQCTSMPLGRPWLDTTARAAATCTCWAQAWICYTDCGRGFASTTWASDCAKACPSSLHPGSCAPNTVAGAAP